jgi:hypothetical protein
MLKVFMHEDEKPFFFDNISPDSNVLEWGSGGSTVALFNHKNVKNIVSIEHDEDWFNRVRNEILYSNTTNEIDDRLLYLYTPPLFNHDYNKHGDGSLTQFYDYVNVIFEYVTKNVIFDTILIDGRARPYCAQIAPLVSHIDTKIFIHDFQFSYAGRENYKLAFESLNLIEQVHDMAMFKPKPECCKCVK